MAAKKSTSAIQVTPDVIPEDDALVTLTVTLKCNIKDLDDVRDVLASYYDIVSTVAEFPAKKIILSW